MADIQNQKETLPKKDEPVKEETVPVVEAKPEVKDEVKSNEEAEKASEEPKCAECKGEGLAGKDRLGNDTVCATCEGTGKVK